MRWGRRNKRGRFWERRGDGTRAERGVLVDALFLFEVARFEGDRKRHWEGDDICSICQAGGARTDEGTVPSRNLRGAPWAAAAVGWVIQQGGSEQGAWWDAPMSR